LIKNVKIGGSCRNKCKSFVHCVGWHTTQQGRSVLWVAGRSQSDRGRQHLYWSSLLWRQTWISCTNY